MRFLLMKKSNNKNHKKFFRSPETPASLPWRRETTRRKINMAENVLVGVRHRKSKTEHGK